MCSQSVREGQRVKCLGLSLTSWVFTGRVHGLLLLLLLWGRAGGRSSGRVCTVRSSWAWNKLRTSCFIHCVDHDHHTHTSYLTKRQLFLWGWEVPPLLSSPHFSWNLDEEKDQKKKTMRFEWKELKNSLLSPSFPTLSVMTLFFFLEDRLFGTEQILSTCNLEICSS